MKKVILALIVGLACMTNAKAGDWHLSIGIPGIIHFGNSYCPPPVVYAPPVVYTPPVVYSPPVVHCSPVVRYGVTSIHHSHDGYSVMYETVIDRYGSAKIVPRKVEKINPTITHTHPTKKKDKKKRN